MKQFIKNNKVTYNLMSFTGYKGLLIFTLLIESPKSYEEVCEYFIKDKYLREKIDKVKTSASKAIEILEREKNKKIEQITSEYNKKINDLKKKIKK